LWRDRKIFFVTTFSTSIDDYKSSIAVEAQVDTYDNPNYEEYHACAKLCLGRNSGFIHKWNQFMNEEVESEKICNFGYFRAYAVKRYLRGMEYAECNLGVHDIAGGALRSRHGTHGGGDQRGLGQRGGGGIPLHHNGRGGGAVDGADGGGREGRAG
jgi:hypothetical protein